MQLFKYAEAFFSSCKCFFQKVGIPDDCVHWRADIVAHAKKGISFLPHSQVLPARLPLQLINILLFPDIFCCKADKKW